MLVCRVFPSQTFAINMQIKTAIFIAIALAASCASASVDIVCPAGTQLDVVTTTGDDGSCNCDNYCATRGEVKGTSAVEGRYLHSRFHGCFGCSAVQRGPISRWWA